MTDVHPADTALLVTRALRRTSTTLAALVGGLAAEYGGLAVVGGLVAVLALHVAVGAWARRRLADRLDREWAAVEPRWSHPRTT